uniref:Mediator of RNA polymerase II transcription subunit 9 n=1 Tax=Leptobrachium leishanense TaxID=445787 RepID=A0A8C5WDQ7_9ANUR
MAAPSLSYEPLHAKAARAQMASLWNHNSQNPLLVDKDSADLYKKLSDLKDKFQAMRKQAGTMPGIDLNPDEQQQHLQNLRQQVQTKNELLQKYKSLCMFEIPKD